MIILSKTRIEIPPRQFQRAVSHFRPTSGGGGGGPPPGPTTIWDTTVDASGITYSNGGLTAASNDGNDRFGIGTQGTDDTNGIYFEATYVSINSYAPAVGLGPANVVSDFFTLACAYYSNGDAGVGLHGLSIPVAGDIVGIASKAGNMWYRLIHSGTPGNWNGSPTANPATNTEGNASGIVGLKWPCFNSHSGATLTLNPGLTFAAAAPSGFGTLA